jgi:DNA recombination protein RmuC
MDTQIPWVAAGAFALGFLIAWLVANSRKAGEIGGLRADAATHQSRVAALGRDHESLKTELSGSRRQVEDLRAAEASATTALEQERVSSNEKLTALLGARDELSNQFKALANEILEEKTKKFTEVNQLSMEQLLGPLQGELKSFRERVDLVYQTESKDRSELSGHIQTLTTLNETLRTETTNLTRVLKSDSKAQGNWGEYILEGLLQKTGFVEGDQYVKQDSQRNEQGELQYPDIVLNMPHDRKLVIDSKMTFTDYSTYAMATDDAEREAALKRHLNAVRRHIDGLSGKEYTKLYGIQTLDFVVMFMPLEGAYSATVIGDADIFEWAWKRNIIVVGPSSLLFVLRTIAHLWRQEAQSRNHIKIAQEGTALYDKFVGFIKDLRAVESSLENARTNYDSAWKKLSSGKGNIMRRIDNLTALGVKVNKPLAAELVEAADDDAEDVPEEAELSPTLAPDGGELVAEIE